MSLLMWWIDSNILLFAFYLHTIFLSYPHFSSISLLVIYSRTLLLGVTLVVVITHTWFKLA